MDNVKSLRSFYILNVSPAITNQSSLILRLGSQSQNPIIVNNERVFVTTKDFDHGLLEIELLWETLEEINSARLSDNGEIISEIDLVKKVSSLVIWIYSGSPFIFAFVKGALFRKVIKFLETVFEGYHVWETRLQDDFFRRLLESNSSNDVTQLTYVSSINNQEFMTSISGNRIENSEFWPRTVQGIIKEITLRMNGNTLKINQRGRVSLFNSPYFNDVREITEYLTKILITSFEGGNSLERFF